MVIATYSLSGSDHSIDFIIKTADENITQEILQEAEMEIEKYVINDNSPIAKELFNHRTGESFVFDDTLYIITDIKFQDKKLLCL